LYDTAEIGGMNGPPHDDSAPDIPPDDDNRDGESVRDGEPVRDADPDVRERPEQRHADAAGTSPAERGGGPENSEFDDPVGGLLPYADVDSRWWYWIAAIPAYVVIAAAVGLLFAVVALLGFGIGIEAGFVGFGLLFVLAVVLGVVGLALTILFPVATYVDARAIAAADAPWTPDPLVWGLAALATVVLSAFTLSFVLALYYLYKRHVAVGTP